MSQPLKNRAFAQGIYAQSATAKEVVGTVRYTKDGRKFVYCKAGEALYAGKVGVAKAIGASVVNEVIATAISAGEKTFTLTVTTGTAIVENQFAGGYLQVNDEAGEGDQYLIESNSAMASSGTTLVVSLAEGEIIRTALTTSSEITLVHPVGYYITHESNSAKMPVCIPVIDVTSGYYFWGQCGGLANVLITGTPAAYTKVGVDDTVEGAAKALATLTYPAVGIMYEVGVNTDYKPVMLTMN